MKALVTGGCGFIGSTVVRTLLSNGWEVRVLDNLSVGSGAHLPPGVELTAGSVTDREALKEAVFGTQAVVHLAAMASVLESVADPWPGFDVNVRGTLMTLEVATEAGVGRFIFASSNAAVGEHDSPIDETLPSSPASPYGASKAAGEAYCSAFSRSRKLRTASLRFANAYGPYSLHKSSVVVKFLRMLLSGEPLPIYGDGLQTRDFVYVQDIADAILLAIQNGTDAGVIQIATGVETSVIDLVDTLAEVIQIRPNLAWMPQPEGEIRRNYSSVEHAARTLGFRSKVALSEGLRETYKWMTDPSRGTERLIRHEDEARNEK